MGGTTEGQKYEKTYAYTLDLYRSFFGQPPPELWEDIKLRFNPVWTAYYHIDVSRFINYMGTVKNIPAGFDEEEINPAVDIMFG